MAESRLRSTQSMWRYFAAFRLQNYKCFLFSCLFRPLKLQKSGQRCAVNKTETDRSDEIERIKEVRSLP